MGTSRGGCKHCRNSCSVNILYYHNHSVIIIVQLLLPALVSNSFVHQR